MKAHFRILIVVLALALTALACGGGGQQVPAAETTAPPAAVATDVPSLPMGEPYSSENGGYSFNIIPGYAVEEFFGFAFMAPIGADPDDESNLVIMIGEENVDNQTLNQVFDEFMADVGDTVQVTNITDRTVAGLPGRTAELSGTSDDGLEMRGRIFVGADSSQVFAMYVAAEVSQWAALEPYFEALLNTLAFFPPTAVDFGGDLEYFSQWAINATASSQYGSDSWSAMQATGEPDTYPECGDIGTSWAAATRSDVDTLELDYAYAMYVSEINIYQTYSPDQVTLVELRDESGNYNIVWGNVPSVTECPFILSILLDPPTDYLVTGVRITVDHTVLSPTSWNEIDAVELYGTSPDYFGGDFDFTEDGDAGDTGDFVTPANFLYREYRPGGALDGQFGSLGGMDVDNAGHVYITDNFNGVWKFNAALEVVANFDHPQINNAADVAFNPVNNRIYVAAWGSDDIYAFTPNGEFITRWGEEGNGPGQFGTFSPQVITVGPNGDIYALDRNEDDAGNDFDRVQVFSPEGVFKREFRIDEDFFAPTDMTFGPNGNLYVMGFVGGYIIEMDENGNVLDRFGEDIMRFTGPQSIFITAFDTFIVARWTPDSAIHFERDGTVIGIYGAEWGSMTGEIPEGGIAQANHAVFLNVGSGIILIADQNGSFGHISAFAP